MKKIFKVFVPLLVIVALISTKTPEIHAESLGNIKKEVSPTVDTVEVDLVNSEVSPMVVPVPSTQMVVAWKAGIKIVENNYGHLFTADLMEIALDPPTSKYYDGSSRAATLINGSSIFKNILKNGSSKFSKTETVPLKGSSVFTSGELHTALNKFNYNLNVEYNSSKGKYYYYGYITDTYDFEWDNYNATYKGFAVTFANNYAVEMKRLGLIDDYEVRIFVNGYY